MHPAAMTGASDEGRDLLPAATTSLPSQKRGGAVKRQGGLRGSVTRKGTGGSRPRNHHKKKPTAFLVPFLTIPSVLMKIFIYIVTPSTTVHSNDPLLTFISL